MINLSATLAAFFHMGGYGAIVWPAWAITLFILIYNIIVPRIKMRQLRKMIVNSPNPRAVSELNDTIPKSNDGN